MNQAVTSQCFSVGMSTRLPGPSTKLLRSRAPSDLPSRRPGDALVDQPKRHAGVKGLRRRASVANLPKSRTCLFRRDSERAFGGCQANLHVLMTIEGNESPSLVAFSMGQSFDDLLQTWDKPIVRRHVVHGDGPSLADRDIDELGYEFSDRPLGHTGSPHGSNTPFSTSARRPMRVRSAQLLLRR